LGLTDKASWHDNFKNSAYVYIGGLDYDLTEGDLLAVFAQYGEVVDVNLIKDKKTGKSRGFAFLAYENQKSTILAVDNLSGARVAGRIIRVEHVADYKRKREEGDSSSDAEEKILKKEKAESTKRLEQEPPEPEMQSSTKRRDSSPEPGGSLFDMMNAHLKKKQKSFPGIHCTYSNSI